jgi:hypothetical protein
MPKGVDPSRLAIRDQTAPPPDVLVALRAAEQQGQITTAELRVCGLNGDAVLRRVRNGHLHPVYRGVYAVGHAGATREGRFMAAVLACGDLAYLSWSAVGMFMEYLPWEERLPEVPRGVRRRPTTSTSGRCSRWRHAATDTPASGRCAR